MVTRHEIDYRIDGDEMQFVEAELEPRFSAALDA